MYIHPNQSNSFLEGLGCVSGVCIFLFFYILLMLYYNSIKLHAMEELSTRPFSLKKNKSVTQSNFCLVCSEVKNIIKNNEFMSIKVVIV